MNRLYISFILLLFSTFKVVAADHDILSWWRYTQEVDFKNKWNFRAEFDARLRFNNFSLNSTLMPRVSINYKIGNSIIVGGGVGLFLIHTESAENFFNKGEFRIFQLFQYNQVVPSLTITQRLMFEERINSNEGIIDLFSDNNNALRIRYRLQFVVPMPTSRINKMSFVVSNEIFYHAWLEDSKHSFDQNRIYLGLRNQLTDVLVLDTAYILMTRNNRRDVTTNHLFFINLTYQLKN